MNFVILIETKHGLDASMTAMVYEDALELAEQVRAGRFKRFRDISNVYVCEIRATL